MFNVYLIYYLFQLCSEEARCGFSKGESRSKGWVFIEWIVRFLRKARVFAFLLLIGNHRLFYSMLFCDPGSARLYLWKFRKWPCPVEITFCFISTNIGRDAMPDVTAANLVPFQDSQKAEKCAKYNYWHFARCITEVIKLYCYSQM